MTLRHVAALVGLSGFLATWVVACSGAPLAADYDQSCKVDADCVPVWSGTCEGCECPNDAINRSEQTRFEGDIQRSGCKPTLGCACVATSASCKDGTCVVVKGGTGTGGGGGSGG